MNLQHINVGTGAGGVGTSVTSLTVTLNLSTPGDALNVELFNANSPATVQAVNLTTGNNTFNTTTCPALATAGIMIIMPPPGNGQTLTLKAISADTGLSLSTVGPTMISLATAPFSSFVLVAGGAITALQIIFV